MVVVRARLACFVAHFEDTGRVTICPTLRSIVSLHG